MDHSTLGLVFFRFLLLIYAAVHFSACHEKSDTNLPGGRDTGEVVVDLGRITDTLPPTSKLPAIKFNNTTFDTTFMLQGNTNYIFTDIVFNGDFVIESRELKDANIEFNNCVFKGKVNVTRDIRIRSLSYFKCTFFKEIQIHPIAEDFAFMYCSVQNDMNATGAHFGNANFLSTEFNGFVDFAQTYFIKNAWFDDAVFEKNASFFGSVFPATITLNRIQSKNELDFTSIQSAKADTTRHWISLYGADVEKIKMNYNQFRLDFNQAEIHSKEQQNNIFLSLLSKFQKDGFTDSYKKLDLEYRRFHAENFDKTLITYWVQKLWWNFGYNKELVFIHALWMLLLFSIISSFRLQYLVNNVYSMQNINERMQNNRSYINKLLLSFYYTAVIFFKLKLDVPNFHFRHHGWTIYLLLIYTAGTICTAFMFNYFVKV